MQKAKTISMKGYKGFDENWKCRDKQYAVGKTYTHLGKIELCHSGLHFVENPLDLFYYYPPTGHFAEVEASGVSDETSDDSKRVAKKLKISTELSLHNLVDAGVRFTLSKIDFTNAKESNTGYQSVATNTGDQSVATNTGDHSAVTNTGDQSVATNTGYRSVATNTGDRSVATNTGDQSVATNTGDRSVATNTGDHSAVTNTGYQSVATVEGNDSVAIVTGYKSKASGKRGCWLVLTEREDFPDWVIKEVKAVKVDGKTIKEDTFYKLENGEVIAV